MAYKTLKIAIGCFILIMVLLSVSFYITQNPVFFNGIPIVMNILVGYVFGYYGKYLDE